MDERKFSFKNSALHFLAVLKAHKLLLVVCVILLSILFMVYADRKPQKQETTNIYENNNILFIKSVSPKEYDNKIPKKISIEFNDEVDKDVFSQNFYLSPETKGTIKYGSSKDIIEFIPEKPFQKNVGFSFTLLEGLTSKNSKSLLTTYTSSFSTYIGEFEVEFLKDNLTGKVLSYSNNKPIALEIKRNNDEESIVTVYKSTQANLLNYLVYERGKDENGNPNPYDSKYLRNYIPHNKNESLETFIINKDITKKALNLKEGVYYVESVSENQPTGSVFIIVNSVGVLARQDDQKITLTTYNLATNSQVGTEATMGFYNMENAPKQLSLHTYSGFESAYNFNFNQGLDLIIGTIKGETVFIPFKLPNSQADINATNLEETYKLFVYTDRPIYKPKDTVKFSGVLRIDSDSLYKLAPAGKQVRISLTNEEKTDVIVTTNEHGVFSGELELPESAIEGSQYMYASTNLEDVYYGAYAYTYFDIATYTKPEFELTSSVDKEEYKRNEAVKFTLRGKYFNGQPLKDTDVTYAIFGQGYYETEKSVYNSNFNITDVGGMCGGGFGFGDEYYGEELQKEQRITLDSNGKAEVTFKLPADITTSKKITIVAKRKDKVGNEIVSASNAIIHAANYNVFFTPSGYRYKENDQLVSPFYAETLEGEKIKSKEFTYSLLDIDYKDDKSVEKIVYTGTTKTDDKGVGIVSFKIPSGMNNYSKYLSIETKDNDGNKVEIRKNISITKNVDEENTNYWERTSAVTYLKIVSNKNNFIIGDTITLNVNAPKELDALVTLERGRIYQPKIIRLFPGENTIDLKVNTELSPSITVVFSFFADGEYHTEGLSLNVPAMHKLLDVSLTSDKSVYKPEETASLTIKTADADGNAVPASITLSVVDKAIFSLRKSASPPIHSAMYYFRPRSTNASSSLTAVGSLNYGGRGGGGGGGLEFGKVVDTLYWNPTLKTDSAGQAVVKIPLQGFETTWKAQVIGSSDDSKVGQDDTEFLVTSKEVLGVKKRNHHQD